MIKIDQIDTEQMRRIILRQSKRANVGHIGSCLCVVEVLAALYGRILRIPSPKHPTRDRFILSKGHAGLALYAALHLAGWLDAAALDTFCGDGSALGVHPEHSTPGVDFATGSLGHGLSMAAGAALAARLDHSDRRVYCLISDGECNVGSTWEAAMFAAHHRLGNLTAIVDLNGQQAFGRTADVMDLNNLEQRWEAFGWHCATVDGHSVEALEAALAAPLFSAPRMVLARTVFGKGVSFMERGIPGSRNLPVQPVNWHYLPMDDEEFRIAMDELGAGR